MGKAFEKEIKKIEDQGKKQIETLENLKPKEQTKVIEVDIMTNFQCKKELVIDY